MKYLFLLLLLTACGQKIETTTNIARPPQYEDNYYERPGNHEEPEEFEAEPRLQHISEKEYNLYLTNINPYRKEFEQFFEEQLKIYGRNDLQERRVDYEKLYNMFRMYDIYIYIYRENPTNGNSSLQLSIIEHGKTTWHPVPDL